MGRGDRSHSSASLVPDERPRLCLRLPSKHGRRSASGSETHTHNGARDSDAQRGPAALTRSLCSAVCVQLEYALDDDDDKPASSSGVAAPAPKGIWSAMDLTAERRRLHALSSAPAVAVEGLPVIAYESRMSMQPLVIKKGAVHGNRFGTFHHADMIGQPLGTKQRARGKSAHGWVVLLPFAPDLWTLSLTHRTQILYQADIAYILFQLDLKPGDVVFESGTGSGSLSTALATALAPHGHLHSFEFNAERVKKARVDFANNGLSELITVRERDVCGNGFPLIEGGVNAVFLDLPAPWSVLESSARVLKHQGRLCSFSPCIEQVQRVCLKLDELGFSEIITVEVLLRTFEVQVHQAWPVARPQATQPQQQQRTKRAFEQGAGAAAAAAPQPAASSTPAAASAAAADSPAESDSNKKRKNLEGEAITPADTVESTGAEAAAAASSSPSPSPPPAAAASKPAVTAPAGPTSFSHITTKPYQLMRGHTGYLTFATCNKF